MVLVTGPTGSGKTTTLYAALSRDQDRRGQDHHHRGPGRVPAEGHHPDPGEREEGAHLRPRPALDPAPRPRQDHGGGDPRRRDRRHRHPVRAHRPPRLHDRPRQQRDRRAGPLPQHEDRALQLRVRPQLRAGPAAGAHDLRALQARGARLAGAARGVRASTRAPTATVWFYEGAGCLECGGTGYKGRTAISELLDLSDNVRELILGRRSSAEIKRAAREEGMVFLRESAVNKALAGHTTLAGDQQGHLRGGGVSTAALRPAARARPRRSGSGTSWSPTGRSVAVEVRARLGGCRAAGEARARGVALGAAALVELPPGTLHALHDASRTSRTTAAFGRTLRSALERAGVLAGARVALVLPDPVARVALVPAGRGVRPRSATQVDELIRFRLRKSVPFDVRRRGSPWCRGGSRLDPLVAAIVPAGARGLRGGLPGAGADARARRADGAGPADARRSARRRPPTGCSSTGTTATSRCCWRGAAGRSSCARSPARPPPRRPRSRARSRTRCSTIASA